MDSVANESALSPSRQRGGVEPLAFEEEKVKTENE